jgi:Tfp pilus assembly protein PilO
MEMEQLVEKYRSIPLQAKAVVLVLVLAASGYYSYDLHIVPALANLEAANAEMASQTQEVESLNQAGQNIVAVNSDIRKADEEINAMLDLLPVDPEMDRVLSYFASAAKETGVDIREFEPSSATQEASGTPPAAPSATAPAASGAASGSPAPAATASSAAAAAAPVADQNVDKIPLKISLHGSFPQIVAFFDRILGLPRIIRLENFEFKNEGGMAAPRLDTLPRSNVPETSSEPESPKLIISANFSVYYQKGLIDQFKQDQNKEIPAPPPSMAPAAAPSIDGAAPTAEAASQPAHASGEVPASAPPAPPSAGDAAAVPPSPPAMAPSGATTLSAKPVGAP